MSRRLILGCALLALAGCTGDAARPVTPAGTPPPSLAISDGSRAAGNPDFFFLPPMVENPSRHPDYDEKAFNPDLKPTVEICVLTATSEAGVSATTPCRSGPPLLSVTIKAPTGSAYAYDWSVPKSSATATFYRVVVKVGDTRLGYADVIAGSSARLRDVSTAALVPVQDGLTLQIRFRIERYALCSVPGTGPCSSETINLATGGDVTLQLPDGGGLVGVTIPPGAGTGTTTITAAGCADLNPRVTDLPTFGPCVAITANPALSADLTNAATVFICSVSSAATAAGLSHEQQERLTMHRFDAPNTLAALPHASACGAPSASADAAPGLLGALRQGDVRAAARALLAMAAPRPLYAAVRRLDVGAGGITLEFSDFQFALPSKLEVVAGDGQTGIAGSTLPVAPQVRVTDLGGDPVKGARVRFGSTLAQCAVAGGTVSGTTGEVTDGSWTISAGANTRVACGRGLAGSDNNGPRAGVDPFQPLSSHFGDLNVPPNPSPVPVLTGSVAFTATGVSLPATLASFRDGGYSSYGPFASPAAPPEGWPSPTPAVSLGVGAKAPFGGNNTVCEITSGFAGTTFPVDTDIFVTKSVSAPVAGTLEITVRVDNDMRLYVDGVERTSDVPASSSGSYNTTSGFWQHEGCADVGPAVYTLAISPGTHVISVWARDRGAVGYLDMNVVLKP